MDKKTNFATGGSAPIGEIGDAPPVKSAEADGVAWETFVSKVTITPKKVAVAFRDAGFWIAADIEAKPRKAQRVLCGLLGYSAVSLARAARQAKEVNDVE